MKEKVCFVNNAPQIHQIHLLGEVVLHLKSTSALFGITWYDFLSLAVFGMLWTLPYPTSSARHYTISCSPIDLTQWRLPKWWTLINVSQIAITVRIGAANFHGLVIPNAILLALINDLNCMTAFGTRTRASIFMYSSLTDVFRLEEIQTNLCIVRSQQPMDFLRATAIA